MIGGEFDPSLYEPYSGEYRGDIDWFKIRGLGYIDLDPQSQKVNNPGKKSQ